VKKVFILSGESSGELYGSLLARAVKKRWSDIRLFGVGGEKMRSEGVDLISGISGAFGLVELFSSLKRIRETFNKVVRFIKDERPDVVVFIDFPDFNIKVARALQDTGIKVLYYVSPQVWAWRRKRVHTIADLSDRVAVILPFERDYYRETSVPCEFVGHPIFEEFEHLDTKKELKEQFGLKGDTPVCAILPGSRDSELERLLPVVEGFCSLFRERHPGHQIIIPVALNITRERYREEFARLRKMGVLLLEGDAVRVLASSDIAVVASGTAALQTSLLGVPLVVMYRLSPLTYFLGKMIIKVKYINLVNIMLGREVIRELLQGDANPETILTEVERIMTDERYRREMLSSFAEVRTLFRGRKASERVSEIIGELAGW